MPTDLISFLEYFSLACSLFLLHPENARNIRLLIVLLAFTVIAESLGFYFRHVGDHKNHFVYNISVPATIFLYMVIFYRNLTAVKYKKILTVFMVAYPAFTIINTLWIQQPSKFSSFNYIVGALLLVTLCVFYFIELIKRPCQVTLRNEPMFWICSALLMMYLPKCILYSLFEYLVYKQEWSPIFAVTFHALNKCLSVIYFSLLSYASLCRLILRR